MTEEFEKYIGIKEVEGLGTSVRKRIQEISELMSEVFQHPVGTAACEIELTNKLSILLELQKQKNELAMFLERLKADSYSCNESTSRVTPASCSSHGVSYEPSKVPDPEGICCGETQCISPGESSCESASYSLGEQITRARARA